MALIYYGIIQVLVAGMLLVSAVMNTVIAPIGALVDPVTDSRSAEHLRQWVSQNVAPIVDTRAGPREIQPGEYVAVVNTSPQTVEHRLASHGFERNLFSRLKLRDGVPEYGSWVYRSDVFATRQLHIMVFPRDDGRTDVYAHDELSAINPFTVVGHIRGDTQNYSRGVERARTYLSSHELEQSD